jgi:hypothetical protein
MEQAQFKPLPKDLDEMEPKSKINLIAPLFHEILISCLYLDCRCQVTALPFSHF